MSDSFADLWSSSTPSKPQNLPLSQQQKKPAVTGINQQKPGQDLFSLLSSTSTTPSYVGASRVQSSTSLNAGKTGSRPITPSISGSNPGTRPGSSLAQSKPNAGGDAFGDLFSGSSKSGNTANMTMAERAALAQKQRVAAQPPANHSTSSTSQWAGLDSLGGSSSIMAPSKPASTLDTDDWGLGALSSSQKPAGTNASIQAKAKPSAVDDDDWGLGDFGNQSSNVSQAPAPSNTRPGTQGKSRTLWDMEDVVAAPSKSQEHIDSPDVDFDFGNREYRETPPPRNGSHHDEDDVLGLLSKPVEAVRSSQHQPRSSPAPRPSSRSPRGASPPPHILGQIIEMGFSIPQAKAALARTETGVDVEAALDLLLAESNDSGESRPASRPRSRQQRNFSDEEPSRHQPSPPQRDDNSGTPNAEKLIAQASEIGLSVLSKASLFWNQGKEKVQKVYEEANKNATNTSRDSRPKWMQEASGSRVPEERERPSRGAASSFRDDDDQEESSAFNERPPAAAAAPPRAQRQQEAPRRAADLLFSSEEPKAYVSPFRRKKADPSAPPAPAASPSPVPPRQPPAAPKPKPKRHLPFCSTSTLSRVQQHKAKGTDAFKLGQFSVAADEYTKAIALLPTNHILLVPLQTNRAIAYIRCGECKSAIDDAGGALSIIGSIQGQGSWQSWHPNDEDGGWELENGNTEADGRGGYTFQRAKGSEWTDSWGRGVDLKDGWVKAVKRRAEAFEGLEKWKDARQDWETLAGGGGGGWVASSTRQEAVRGLGRCKKILDGGDSSAPKPAQAAKPKPRPRPTPASSAAATPGVAVEAYRAQVNAQEAEDALKHSLKDNVEEKLMAWKKGKESNLRALLASLDTILWEEVLNDMGKKPGMADLVSAGGVKKWYMKAVSRVHPDKLNANNSTVEQRMIAGGVFGALNEAWLAFKP